MLNTVFYFAVIKDFHKKTQCITQFDKVVLEENFGRLGWNNNLVAYSVKTRSMKNFKKLLLHDSIFYFYALNFNKNLIYIFPKKFKHACFCQSH